MPVKAMRAFESKYNVSVLEGYGLTETSPLAVTNRMFRPKKPGSIGLPITGVDVKIFDEWDCKVPRGEPGEIVIRGPNVMKGYYKKPQATSAVMQRGWFHTGDVGVMDEEGYLYIVGRKKEMILRGGFNVSPREVEEVLYTHPAILEAAVIGIPDEHYGEEVKAFIVLKPHHHLTAAEVIAYCKVHLAAFKYPRIVEFALSLPKGPTGKILKKELREKEARERGEA